MYVAGESEKIIGRFPSSTLSRCRIHTKAYPGHPLKGLTRSSVLGQCAASLSSLGLSPSPSSPPLDIFYLHWPDPSTPIMETLTAVNELHQQGAFRRFGLSNYSSWQVMDIYNLCTSNNFCLPSVYQGMYNALTRAVEPELFPCLRHLNMTFYAYNPLAGGILSGKYKFSSEPSEPGRFAGNEWAERYKERFWKQEIFDAIDHVQNTLQQVESEGGGDRVTITEASLRWLRRHSGLSGDRGDCIVIGASKEDHVAANLKGVQGGPLDERVVKAFDEAWAECKAQCPNYFR